MRRLLLLLAIPTLLAGCGAVEAPETPGHAPEAAPATQAKMEPPAFDKTTKIALIRNNGRVVVGDDLDHALGIYKEPAGSYHVTDLPSGFTNDPDYHAEGWENATEGFGVILYKEKIGLALYQLEKADQDRLDEILKTYTDDLGPPTAALPPPVAAGTPAAADRVQYWFWEQGAQRLMISSLKTDKGSLNIGVAMGDHSLMDALGMSQERAAQDKDKAESFLKQKFERENAPSAAKA